MKEFTTEQIRFLNKKSSLVDMYEKQKLSVDKITAKTGIGQSTIFNRLKLYNIKTRKRGRYLI